MLYCYQGVLTLLVIFIFKYLVIEILSNGEVAATYHEPWLNSFQLCKNFNSPWSNKLTMRIFTFFYSSDFEKLCSVSLSRINVYACLVCGKYFQGRGHNTHAYTHSVSDEQHRVFVNLATKKFYCLPDNYEIIDPSLSDIIYVLDPTYTLELINKLETSGKG